VVAYILFFFFFFQAEVGIRDFHVTGVQTCALPISITSTARCAVELSDFPCALVGVRGGRVAFSFHSQAMIDGGFYPRPRGSALRSEERRVGKECRTRWWQAQ